MSSPMAYMPGRITAAQLHAVGKPVNDRAYLHHIAVAKLIGVEVGLLHVVDLVLLAGRTADGHQFAECVAGEASRISEQLLERLALADLIEHRAFDASLHADKIFVGGHYDHVALLQSDGGRVGVSAEEIVVDVNVEKTASVAYHVDVA